MFDSVQRHFLLINTSIILDEISIISLPRRLVEPLD